MEPRVSPELEEESIIIVYAGLETSLYATDMERGVEFRGWVTWKGFYFRFYRGKIRKKYDINYFLTST